MKIIIVDDETITARVLEKRLKKHLAGSGVEICSTRIRKTSTITSSTSEIREFYGLSEELKEKVREANILAVHKAPVTREIIEHAPNLKLIACARHHPVNIEVSAATQKCIPVVYAPGRAAVATAELTISLILLLARNIIEANRYINKLGNGAWDYSIRSNLEGMELQRKNLGIIGFGRVGKEVALRARAFKMNILVYSLHATQSEINNFQAKLVALEELLQKSDFVTLHAQVNEKNKGMIGKRELSLMKKSAYLINTARGTLVDEEALYEALVQGKIAGAAIDVLTQEPPDEKNPLLTLNNVIVTPHLGGKTREVPERAARMIAYEIKRFLQGKKARNVVNQTDIPFRNSE